MNPKVDVYFTNARKWQKELEKLRKILVGCRLTEELKWGKPCYTFQGSNVVILLSMKETCALLFCKGALLKDPQGILIKPGENTQAARQMRFTDAGAIGKMTPIIKSYIQQAIEVEKAGLEVIYKKPSDFIIPEELKKKLDELPALKKAFEALTPGRQRGYILYFSAAKQSKTRETRIEKQLKHILKGKGMNDR